MIYVFDDVDYDGSSDLPVDLYVSGAHNTGNVSIGSIPQNSYYLAGNPYIKTIDWDDVSKPIYHRSYLSGMMLLVHGRHGTDHLVILAMDSLHHSKDFGYKLVVGLEVSLSRAMILQPVQALFRPNHK